MSRLTDCLHTAAAAVYIGVAQNTHRKWAARGDIPMHQNHIFAVRCFPHKLRPSFLAYATASRYGRDYFEATGKRTANLANTNATKVGQFPIPLPSIAVQNEICEYLDIKLAEVKRIASKIDAQIATLTAYRKSLIHQCVTGQRRITEADLRKMSAAASLPADASLEGGTNQ